MEMKASSRKIHISKSCKFWYIFPKICGFFPIFKKLSILKKKHFENVHFEKEAF
jgi:hypothetical protein